jgi:hypothetical protein
MTPTSAKITTRNQRKHKIFKSNAGRLRAGAEHMPARVKIFNWWADQKGRVTNEVLEQMWKDIMDYKREWPDLRL